jgi:hypothetical protein
MLQTISIIVGVVSGVSGLLLGILNYLEQRYRTRPRVRVRPCVVSVVDRQSQTAEHGVGAIEVSNIGSVPVIGSTVGFRAKYRGGKEILIVTPIPLNGVLWTAELKPGNVSILRMKLEELPSPDALGCACATTLVGDIFLCSRGDMKKFRDDLASIRRCNG